MKTLMDQMVTDGITPWCIGIESGDATGWVATDWMEDIMLRTTSLENYDKWTRGELAFTSPEVKKAAETMADIWQDKYVYGGRQQIVATSFQNAPTPMFDNPPKCWMHRQGNFVTSFFPTTAVAGTDYAFFYLPPIDEQYGKPVLFAGDIMTAFRDAPEVRAVMQWFTTFEGVKGWAAAGGALAPHNDSDPNVYSNDVDKGVAQILLDASSVRFDGSDLMPGAVGSGTFWRGMTRFVSGQATLDQALEEIQAGWTTVTP
jgi:alpha-glucoside transport system substrate-binding protein